MKVNPTIPLISPLAFPCILASAFTRSKGGFFPCEKFGIARCLDLSLSPCIPLASTICEHFLSLNDRSPKNVKLMLSHSNVVLTATFFASSSHFQQLLNLRDKSLKVSHLHVIGNISIIFSKLPLFSSFCISLLTYFRPIKKVGEPIHYLVNRFLSTPEHILINHKTIPSSTYH